MRKSSFQLFTKDPINSFDYSDDLGQFIVATNKYVMMSKVNSFPNVCNTVRIEQPNKIRQVRVQKGVQPKFSYIVGGAVNVCDMNKRVDTVVDVVRTVSSINDHKWSLTKQNLLCCTHDNGTISLWDSRSMSKATHLVSLGKSCSDLQFCPWNENVLSVSCEKKYVLLWDNRVTRSGTCSQTLKSDSFHILEPPDGVFQHVWDVKSSFLYVGTGGGLVQQWSVDRLAERSEGPTFDCINRKAARCSSMTSSSLMVSTPCGLLVSTTNQRKVGFADIRPRVSSPHSAAPTAASKTTCSVCFTRTFHTDLPQQYGPDDKSWTDLAVSNSTGIVGMQWISKVQQPDSCIDPATNLLIVTDSGLLHTVVFPDANTTSSTLDSNDLPLAPSLRSGFRTYSLRNARHATGGLDQVHGHHLNKRTSGGRSFGALSACSTSTPTTVGPLTFSALMEDDVIALDVAVRSGLLDGLRIERFDQFSRRIVLEVLVPAIDSYSMRSKSAVDSNFAHYYRSEDLHQFLRKSTSSNVSSGHNARTVSLVVSFPASYASFWSPHFAVDNKCGVELGGDVVLAAIVGELVGLCKAFSATTALLSGGPLASRRVFSSSRGNDDNGLSGETCLLVQIARSFRRRILKAWEKKVDSDRLSVSFGSYRQSSSDNFHSGSGNTASLLASGAQASCVSSGSPGDLRGVDLQATCFSSIEERAFSVPFPPLSGGVFNSFGEIVCFGKAALSSSVQSATVLGAEKEEFGFHRSYGTFLISAVLHKSESGGALNAKTASSGSLALDKDDSDKSLGASRKSKRPHKGSVVDACSNELDGVQPLTSKVSFSDASREGDELDEEEEEDYQFSFDKETKTPVHADSAIRTAATADDVFVAGNVDDAACHASDCNPSVPFAGPSSSSHFVYIKRAILTQERVLARHYSLGRADCIGTGDQPILANVSVKASATVASKAAVCRENAALVHSLFPDAHTLFQFWNLLAVSLDVSTITDTGGLINWHDSALGCSLFFRLFRHLRDMNDLQTFAVAICVVGGASVVVDLLKNYHVGSADSGLCASVRPEERVDPRRLEQDIDSILYSYSELLLRWGENILATEVTKHIQRDPARITTSLVDLRPLSINVHCFSCDALVSSAEIAEASDAKPLWCRACEDWAQFCSICQTSVRGIYSVCATCGHGGHPEHMKSWFARYSECATGCGCRCTLGGRGGAQDDELGCEDEFGNRAAGSDRLLDDEDEDIYERDEETREVFRSVPQQLADKASVYDTYDFNRPHYIESVLSESNYREYNYNNFYETMQDFPESILEEGDYNSDDEE